MASTEVSINQLPTITNVESGNFVIVQTENATNKLDFKDFVVGLENTTFANTINDNTTNISAISSAVGLAGAAGATASDGTGTVTGTGFSLSNCKETTVGILKIKSGEMQITSTAPVDVTFPTAYSNNHLGTMFVLKDSAGAFASIGDAGTRQRLESISNSGFTINLTNALAVSGIGQQYFYLSLGT